MRVRKHFAGVNSAIVNLASACFDWFTDIMQQRDIAATILRMQFKSGSEMRKMLPKEVMGVK